MTDESRLRTASDAFLARLDRLHELETEKRLLTPGSPRMVGLAGEIEDLVRDVLETAGTQLELAEKAQGTSHMRPIEAVPPRDAPEILADWRAAERRLNEAGPGTADEDGARADIERLRAEYSRAFDRRAKG
jgi:hypothetical protein